VLSVAARMTFADEGNKVYKATYKESMFGSGRRNPVEFLTVHMRTYLESEMAKMLKVYTTQASFFRTKADTLEQQFRAVEKEMVEYQEKNADRLPGQEPIASSTRATLEAHRADITAQLLRVEADLSNARRQITAGRPLAPWREQSALAYRQQLAAVNGKIADAQGRGLGPQHPEMVELVKQRDKLQEMLNEQLSAPASNIERQASGSYAAAESGVDALEAQARGLRAQASAIDRDLGRVRSVMAELPRVTGRVNELIRQRDLIKHSHEVALQEQQKAEMQLDLEKVNAQSRYDLLALPQLEPVRKKKTLAIRTGIGLGVGIFLTVIVIFLLEARRIVAESMGRARRRGYAGT
jgi:hypothetical protein